MTVNVSLDQQCRLTVTGAPSGQDVRTLVSWARNHPAGVLHLAQDDTHSSLMVDMVRFFEPSADVMLLPAWDCLPYDRVSPNGEIVNQRIRTLTRLLKVPRPGRPRIVIATINAALQRVPPRRAFKDATFTVAVGDRLDMAALNGFLAQNGYNRTDTVREPGEFAVRGGIVDLFPPGSAEPVRLDLFGDDIDEIRTFDPLSQRTTGKAKRLSLKRMSEVLLTDDAIQRFRSGYREAFGAVTSDDPLYDAVSEGRRHAGMEHWLPLFHSKMETIFDYLPGALVTEDSQAAHAATARLEQVTEFFEARATMMRASKGGGTAIYKPLAPERLYLMGSELDTRLATRFHAVFSPFGGQPNAEGSIDAGGRRGRDFSDARALADRNVFDVVRDYVSAQKATDRMLLVASYSRGSRERLRALLSDHGFTGLENVDTFTDLETLPRGNVGIAVLGLEAGCLAPDLCIVTEQDILGDRLTRPQRKKRKSNKAFVELSALQAGDLIVHDDHGIGRYEALETIKVAGADHDCLRIVYDGNDKLFLPVENLEVLSRYGSDQQGVQLDKLGGAAWQARRAKVKKKIRDMADELLRIAAARQVRTGQVVTAQTGSFEEFCARFPYPETDDQLRAIEDVIDDLGKGQPMDRLICGDVGFGKTEVALRAAFLAAMSGFQVAVVVPTTLLARQHFRTFSERFRGLPVRVAQLSRLVSPKDARTVREEVSTGDVQILVGTHAVLGKSVTFSNLGLLIVDEEQHFGVRQKERLKQMRDDVHVLTLTATPIPRTLQMALAGVRELSLIATPPVDRLAVRTFVLPYDPVVIREAILREHFRGGQTFYVCPRIEDLPRVQERLAELVPEVKVVTANGQMPASELEDRMGAFYDGKYDILLATNIVESGLDIPTANTLIIHRSDLFGLASLYQLRGRVGRSKVRGYAYFTYSARDRLTANAAQRLHVIETLDTLGAGFQLASYDLDLRGAGNLLGEEQSGHVREVGMELYQQMLEEAVEAAKAEQGVGEAADERWTPQINIGMPVLIPDAYVADLNVRLSLYRRLAEMTTRKDIEAFAAELIDRFGPLPGEVENLLNVIRIKALCRSAGVERVDAGPKGAVVTFRNNRFERVDKLMEFITQQAGTVKLRPDQKLIYIRAWQEDDRRVKGVQRVLKDLATMAA